MELFTAPEIARACAFKGRTIEILKREGLTPKPATMRGRGGAANYDFVGLSRFVAIGALSTVTGSAMSAARLANSILPEPDATYGGIPWGQRDLQRELQAVGVVPNSQDNYALFVECERNGLCQRGKSRRNDFRILIADGRYVFEARTELLPLTPKFDGDTGAASLLAEIVFGPGNDPERVRSHLEIPAESHASLADHLRNATVVVQVNLSLALRSTFAGILDLRSEKAVRVDAGITGGRADG